MNGIFANYLWTTVLGKRELIDTEHISLPSQNMKFVGEWAKRTSHKLHILSSRLIFFSKNKRIIEKKFHYLMYDMVVRAKQMAYFNSITYIYTILVHCRSI
jgi:hypothetical protein